MEDRSVAALRLVSERVRALAFGGRLRTCDTLATWYLGETHHRFSSGS